MSPSKSSAAPATCVTPAADSWAAAEIDWTLRAICSLVALCSSVEAAIWSDEELIWLADAEVDSAASRTSISVYTA
ncbi:hypothetical protein [Salinibacter ruber]|uniref:hypothetical protein n=1 Tax=Salinibacter ruber TaxID=146919 RepID=UPI002072EF05|nr:hypothetical protein [Salinibacter ruber]